MTAGGLSTAALALAASVIAAGAVLWWVWGPVAALSVLAKFCL